MTDLGHISQRLMDGDIQGVETLIREALDSGISAQQILNRGLLPGMNLVGQKFKKHQIYVPEVVLSAKAMLAGMELLRPQLEAGRVKPSVTIVIGTVQGDLHDIGKNLVSMMLKGAGFEVVDLGIDVSPQQFAQAVAERKAHILALSALLTTSMPNMKKTLEALQTRKLRRGLIVMVGGAPVTQAYADEIGADGYAQNASLAVDKAKELLKSRAPQYTGG
jgi:5-methyltetrahydrofolate--homocysteine methyltransferase